MCDCVLIKICYRFHSHYCDHFRKWQSQLHADLFLVRHLLILREQLMPFDIQLQSVEKELDFAPTTVALSAFLRNSRAALRWDSDNSLLAVARDGLPGMQEASVDIKKRLDEALRSSCLNLKLSILHFVMPAVESFLAKVAAFIGGDVPVYRGAGAADSSDGGEVLLTDAARSVLSSQAFVKAERVVEVLSSTIETIVQTQPELVKVVRAYLDNDTTRHIILKPVMHELQLSKRKVVSVFHPSTTRIVYR